MAARRVLGAGQVYVWAGGTLWIGRATGGTDLHAHHAVQVSLGWSGEVRFRAHTGPWRGYRACLVPNDVAHAFTGDDIEAAQVFVEPESATGRLLLERFGGSAIRALPDEPAAEASRVLFEAWHASRAAAHMVPAARHALAVLAGGETPAATTDPRVLGAIEVIRARLDGPVRLTDVAREIYVSPSRLRHLFVQETGLPFRRYVLWQRLQLVFAMMPTHSLTEAAHAAGFADAAHMSRVFRRMLGIVPTNLVAE